MANDIKKEEDLKDILDDFITLREDEDELNSKIDLRDTESKTWMKDKFEEWKENRKWLDGDGMPNNASHQSSVQINLLWANYRNQVELLADQKPGLIAYPKPKVLENADEKEKQAQLNKLKSISQKIEEQTRYLWENKLHMSKELKKVSWSLVGNNVGFLMPFWDYLSDDIGTIYIPETWVRLSPGASNVDESEYAFIEVPHNKKWFRQHYPNEWNKIKYGKYKGEKTEDQDTETEGSRQSQSILQIYLEDELYVYRAKSNDGKTWIILDKGQNPLYNFEYDYQESVEDEFPKDNPNIFDRPKKPLVMFNLPEDSCAYSVSTTKRLIPIQKDINEGKRQVIDNSKRANGKLLVDAETFSEDEARKIDFTKTNQQAIRIAGLRDNPRAALFIAPQPQNPIISDNMTDSRQMMDRLTGQYAESRGEFNPSNKTASGIRSLQEASQIPIRALSRAVEQGVSELGMWWLQLMKMFYTEPHYIRRLGEEDARELIEFSNQDIPEGTTVMVKEGSMMPRPEEQQEDMAVILGEKQLISPQSVLEKLKYPDAKKEAIRLANWMQGIVSDEQQQEQGAESGSQIDLAMQENEQMMQGHQVSINESDEDDKHIAVHMQLAQTQEAEQPQIAQVLAQHIQAHEQAIAQKGEQGQMGGQMQKPMDQPMV